MTSPKSVRVRIIDGICRILSKSDVTSKLSSITQVKVLLLLDKPNARWSTDDVAEALRIIGETFASHQGD